jgi:hypothetical protein
MTASALFDFLIGLIVLAALALIALLVAGVFFGGAGLAVVSGMALVEFGIAIIAALVVLYLLELVLSWLGSVAGLQAWTGAIKYVAGAIALITLLWFADEALFSGGTRRVAELAPIPPGQPSICRNC